MTKMEDWVSGLNQRFTKPSGPNRPREFESHILRKRKTPERVLFCFRRMSKTLVRLTLRFERRKRCGFATSASGSRVLRFFEQSEIKSLVTRDRIPHPPHFRTSIRQCVKCYILI